MQVKLRCADCRQPFARNYPISQDKELRCPKCNSINVDYETDREED